MQHLINQAVGVFEVVAYATDITPDQKEILLDGANTLRGSDDYSEEHPAFEIVKKYRKDRALRFGLNA